MKNKTKHTEPAYLTNLRKLCQSVVFTLSRSEDESFTWDGQGPDPIKRGYHPYDVDVKATTIARGEFIEGTASLGGSYYKEDEPLGDVHGYLPQMLEEAMNELLADPAVELLTRDALIEGVRYIKQVMRVAYTRQVAKRIKKG